MKILGIDPGLRNVGWGIIEKNNSKISYVASGVIKTSSSESMVTRLLEINQQLNQILTTNKPDQVAIEEVFINKNASTSLKLGQARGAILVTVATLNIEIFEYAANLIKKSVTGSGHADKTQIATMLKMLFRNSEYSDKNPDANDAIATAICHSSHYRPKT